MSGSLALQAHLAEVFTFILTPAATELHVLVFAARRFFVSFKVN